MLKNLLAKMFGKYLENKAGLYDGTPSEGKAWFKSKTIWAGIYGIVRGLYFSVSGLMVESGYAALPEYPILIDGLVGAILGGATIQGRVNASEPIVIDESKSPKDQQ